jgi:hypothetical protein
MAKPARSIPAQESRREITRLYRFAALMRGAISHVAASANAWTARFVASLDETRRQQADGEISRHRYLFRDCDSDMYFRTRTTFDDAKDV